MTTVYIAGVWDLFHVGHLRAIQKAKTFGDKLVVGVCTDALAATLKDGRPVIPYEERCEIIRALRCVDEVEPSDSHRDYRPMQKHGVTVRVVGTDYGYYEEQKVALAEMKEQGIEIVVLPRTEGISTSIIVEKVRDKVCGPSCGGVEGRG